ncbi:MAG: RluA family pseudouridine synthase [Deltaproteobacteria bacterium]|nr:RluA family pseudouridine synthase [Deltaproteobacteria bacterium]
MSHRLVVAAPGGDRLDRWLKRQFPQAPNREIDRLLANGLVRVDGKRAAKGTRLLAGQVIELEAAPIFREHLAPAAETGELEVLFEDEALLAVNKQPGMPTHPLDAGELGTVANRVARIAPECVKASDDPREGGAAHRLDIGTSGVLVFARNPESHTRVREQFRAHEVNKRYLALCRALPDRSPIELALEQRGRRAAPSTSGQPALTEWKQLAAKGGYHLLECNTRTGRRHQIRAHLAAAGAAIVGNELYQGPPGPDPLIGFFLHASRIELSSPASGPITVEAALPSDRRLALQGSQIDVQ